MCRSQLLITTTEMIISCQWNTAVSVTILQRDKLICFINEGNLVI